MYKAQLEVVSAEALIPGAECLQEVIGMAEVTRVASQDKREEGKREVSLCVQVLKGLTRKSLCHQQLCHAAI